MAVTVIQAEPDQALVATGRSVMIDARANDAGAGPASTLRVHVPPAHGSVRVVGGQFEYTPAPGFTGRDSFSYLIKGTRSLGTATVTVDVGKPLVLRGKVTDSPIVNASVQASVDGNSFSAQADANGDYSLEIIGLDGGMVTLGAQGTGDQAIANFLSVAGGFDRLLAEAGADGQLTRDENNQVQVTNVSTAQAYLMQLASGGLPINNDAALEVAREAIDNGQLLTASAAIKLAVDGGFALPDGTTDTLALLSAPGALQAFLEDVEEQAPGALAEAIVAIASDPDLTVPSDEEDMVGTYTLVYDLGVPGTVNTGYIQGARLTLDADGGGEMLLAAPNANPAVTWSFDSVTGRAVVVPVSPVVVVGFEIVNNVQVRRDSVTSRYEVARLFEGNGRDTLAVTSTVDYWYPENPGIPSGSTSGTASNVGVRDGQGTLAFSSGEIAGSSRSMAISDTPYATANNTGAELFTFAANGSGVRADGLAFTWQIDPLGRLQVADAAGSSATYARVSSDGRGAEGLAVDWTSPIGRRSATLQISAIADGFAFTPASAQADWLSGQNISRTAYMANNTGFYILLRGAGLGWTLSTGEGYATPTPGGWSVQGGVMDFTLYRNGSHAPVHWCQVGVNGCYVFLARRWRPVGADAGRVYVIEEFLWDTDGDGDLDVTSQRGNFYDTQGAVPPFSVAPPRVPAAAPVQVKPVAKVGARSGR
nr:Ig-like domain-containing protein [Luteimonas sp. MC1828]